MESENEKGEETWKKGSLWGCTLQRCQRGWGMGTRTMICWTRGPLGLRRYTKQEMRVNVEGRDGGFRGAQTKACWCQNPGLPPARQAVALVSSSPPGGGRMQRVSLSRDSPRRRLLATGSLQWPEAPGGWAHLQVEPPLLGLGAASVFCLAGQGQLGTDFLPA